MLLWEIWPTALECPALNYPNRMVVSVLLDPAAFWTHHSWIFNPSVLHDSHPRACVLWKVRSHFGSSHFGSNHVLLARIVTGLSVLSFFLSSVVRCTLCKTSCHATPRMASDGCALRVGACDSGTEAAVGEVASCAPSSFCGPLAFIAVEVQSSDVFQRMPCKTFQPRTGLPLLLSPNAMGEVKKLEAAIAALGADSVHARGLQEALRIARNKSRLPSVAERVESCKKFLERVSRAQDVIDKATAQKAVHEAEETEGERRLAQLQAEASKPVGEGLPQVSALR